MVQCLLSAVAATAAATADSTSQPVAGPCFAIAMELPGPRAAPEFSPAYGRSRGLSRITLETAFAVDFTSVKAAPVDLHTLCVGPDLAGDTRVGTVISLLAGVNTVAELLHTLCVCLRLPVAGSDRIVNGRNRARLRFWDDWLCFRAARHRERHANRGEESLAADVGVLDGRVNFLSGGGNRLRTAPEERGAEQC